MKILQTRYALLFSFIGIFLLLSFLIRTVLVIWSWQSAGLSPASLSIIYFKGLLFDLAVALFFSAAYSVYLLLIPGRFNRSLASRIFTYVGFFLVMLVCMFSFFAEVTFWKEFESRFNFIAVDYLVYTYEVISNINQSYPLPYLIGGMLLSTSCVVLLLEIAGIFKRTFYAPTPFKVRAQYSTMVIAGAILAGFMLSNDWADHNPNRYTNELSKAGIFSFFSAFKNNDLDYDKFYTADNTAPKDIRIEIKDTVAPARPNVIMITIESFSADFMKHFGNTQQLTPTLDDIADHSIVFTDMFATGTRTVRGMEALSLSIPPTPGNSIVRRKNNDGLYSVATVFEKQGYINTFFYGGDGYFDNMNNFFGNNGFNIVDRGNKLIPAEHFDGTRTRIPDSCVHFENAWGICDEDLYDAVIRDADTKYKNGQRFYDFVMTTSNHRPYTYPAGTIDIPSGSGRDGAVRYTDYAIGRFLHKLQSRPWFSNTVVIFVADHCASVAGKEEIDVAHYHIPCMIYNLRNTSPFVINKQCSQIDLYPTLFHLLHWSYTSRFFGENVLSPDYRPRTFVGTYQKLGYLSGDSLIILSPNRQVSAHRWNRLTNEQHSIPVDRNLLAKTVGYYQSASRLFKNGGLRK